MVRLDEAAAGNGWGGIVIETDPNGGNEIHYCTIQNIDGANNHAILVDATNGDAHASIQHNLIQDVDAGDGIDGIHVETGAATVPSVLIQHNRIIGCADGIDFQGNPNNAVALLDDIAHNHISGCTGFGMDIHFEVAGNIRNNILFDNAATQIWVEFTPAQNGRIINNTVNGNGDANANGIQCEFSWSDVRNNIIVNCDVPVGTNAGGNPAFDYCLLFNNDQGPQNCQAGENVIDDNQNPDYVDALNDDYHLFHDSPSINAGDPAQQYEDPDGSDNDMGAFGGRILVSGR